MEWKQILTLAAKEFRDRLRNRWVLAVALVFTVFSLVIAYFGGAAQGQVGLRSIEFTIASLVSLVIYLIPLIALLLGFDAVVGERERGSLDLLLALPITRLEVLLGKYLGLAAALTLSTMAGFGLVALLLFKQYGWAGLYHYIGFMVSSVLLGLAFLSLAVLMSVIARERTRASGLAIAMWFFFVLVFDLLLALPITRLEVLLGKYLGLAAALTLSTMAGFGLVALLLFKQYGWAGLYHYIGFMVSSVLLGLAFLSLAVLMSVIARERTRASGLAIAMWFFFVLVFDLLLLGALVATGGAYGGDAFAYMLLLNPADVFRILNVFSLEDVRTLYGLASIVPPALARPWLMGSVMVAWIVVPLALANWRFKP